MMWIELYYIIGAMSFSYKQDDDCYYEVTPSLTVTTTGYDQVLSNTERATHTKSLKSLPTYVHVQAINVAASPETGDNTNCAFPMQLTGDFDT